MRRAEREVRNVEDILSIIGQCDVCRLAFARGDEAYIVPMNFGYEYTEGRLTLYMHCAGKGRKLDMMKANPRVCFEMDRAHALRGSGETACVYTMYFESVIGSGLLEVCEGREEKRVGLEAIMRQLVKHKDFTFLSEQVDAVTVLRLRADSFSAKRHGPKPGKTEKISG